MFRAVRSFVSRRGSPTESIRLENEMLSSVKDWTLAEPFGIRWHDPGKLCRVVKVYDGDSVTLLWTNVERSPARLVRANCRLHGIDTPELRSRNPEQKHMAYTCRDALSNAILDQLVLVTTHGISGLDKYGRPLVVLKVHPRHTSNTTKEVVKDYESINDWILHTLPGCKPYFGGTKTPVEERKVEECVLGV
jgi:endonuclease YncB( thermonuclease family)